MSHRGNDYKFQRSCHPGVNQQLWERDPRPVVSSSPDGQPAQHGRVHAAPGRHEQGLGRDAPSGSLPPRWLPHTPSSSRRCSKAGPAPRASQPTPKYDFLVFFCPKGRQAWFL